MAIPILWRNKKQRYSLYGEVCVNCSRAVFPPREVCPHCHKSTHVVVTRSSTEIVVLPVDAVPQQALTAAIMAGDD